MALISRNVPLPPDLDKRIRDFCLTTNRVESHTLRCIIRLFFDDGDETAEHRLCRDLWDAKPNKSAKPNRNRSPKEVSP